MNLARLVIRAPRRAAIAVVRFYQLVVSPWLGPSCRFTPTCSSYACGCLGEHGVLRGGWLTARRLARCGPWSPGGYDPVPSRALPSPTLTVPLAAEEQLT